MSDISAGHAHESVLLYSAEILQIGLIVEEITYDILLIRISI